MDGQRSIDGYRAGMRGQGEEQSTMWMLMTLESRVPKDHPLRRVKAMADEALRALSPAFDRMYSSIGRPSIPPERLLKASVLIALYSVRSERQFCEQLDYNLLFRWFLDLNMDEKTFDVTVFTKNRARLMNHDVARQFFGQIVAQAREARLMSSEHFTVDGTLIDSWASMKSFRKKDEDDDDKGDGNGWGDFRGEKRSNETHESKTDPEAKLMRKGFGKEAKLSYSGHALMENRNGLLVDVRIAEANGTAERDVALRMIDEELPGSHRITLGADKGYDAREFVEACRVRGVTPHVAMRNDPRRRPAVDGRTKRHVGYEISQRVRKRVESIFGWMKTTANFRRTRWKGIAKTQLAAYFVGAAYNLMRMARLSPAR
jgi:transposase